MTALKDFRQLPFTPDRQPGQVPHPGFPVQQETGLGTSHRPQASRVVHK
jgi:hypothetical protein